MSSHFCFQHNHHDSSHCSGSMMHAFSCNGRDQGSTPGQGDLSPREMDELLPKLPTSQNQTPSIESYSNAIHTTNVLLRIHTKLDHVTKMISASKEYKEIEDKAKTEWRLVSMVLDRMFLIIFLCLVVFTFIAMFAQIPV